MELSFKTVDLKPVGGAMGKSFSQVKRLEKSINIKFRKHLKLDFTYKHEREQDYLRQDLVEEELQQRHPPFGQQPKPHDQEPNV